MTSDVCACGQDGWTPRALRRAGKRPLVDILNCQCLPFATDTHVAQGLDYSLLWMSRVPVSVMASAGCSAKEMRQLGASAGA